MLQFLKKAGKKKDDPNTIPSSKIEDVTSSTLIQDAEKFVNDNKESLPQSQTKLSRNLVDILVDKNCLSYFIQFLETKKALPHIKFWLDVESFRTSMQVCLKRRVSNADSLKRENVFMLENGNNLNLISKKRLLKSVSSDGFDNSSYTSYDIDSCSLISQQTIDSSNADGISEGNFSLTSISDKMGVQNISRDTLNEQEELSDTTILSTNEQNENGEYKKQCDNDTWRSLTDDEKTQIREKNKITNCNKKLPQSKFQTPFSIDAIRIYKKYFIMTSQFYIDIPATLLSEISLALCPSDVTEDGTNENSIMDCFDSAQKYVFNRLERDYLNEFLESIFYCKFTVDVITKEKITLNDILYNELGLFYFMEFLEQENSRNYLDFWMAAINFKKQINENINDYNHEQAQSDAMILYERYFSLQATNSLKMSDAVRYKIEENICGDSHSTIQGCFDIAINVTEYYLHCKYFDIFIKSPLFYKLLSELLMKIKQSDIIEPIMGVNNTSKNKFLNVTQNHKKRHRKTYSDCTNESTSKFRNSTQNTLLAMESSSSSLRKNQFKKTGSDMHIDSRQLHNPDLLWQRDKMQNVTGLCFGRIDSLGRYKRDFDETEICDNEKWSLSLGRSKLTNVVKKLVNLPEDKVQEELAWQVAEMIVKDITDITLNHTENGNQVLNNV